MIKERSNVKHFSFEYCIPAKQEYEKVYEDKLQKQTLLAVLQKRRS